jgi:hypothetical protein
VIYLQTMPFDKFKIAMQQEMHVLSAVCQFEPPMAHAPTILYLIVSSNFPQKYNLILK